MNQLAVDLAVVVKSFCISVVTGFANLFRNFVELLLLLGRKQIMPQHFARAAHNLVQVLVYYFRFDHDKPRFVLKLVNEIGEWMVRSWTTLVHRFSYALKLFKSLTSAHPMF